MARVNASAIAGQIAKHIGFGLMLAACTMSGLTSGDTMASDPAAVDPADVAAKDIPPQLKLAQENALKWWRDPANHLTTVESTRTDAHGNRLRSIAFILRDPDGRSLAVSRAGSTEMRAFFEQRLNAALRQVTHTHALTEPQVRKLKLAAELDIARFNRRVQETTQLMNQTNDEDTAQPEADDLAITGKAAVKSSLAAIAENCEQGLFDQQSLYTRVLATLLEEH